MVVRARTEGLPISRYDEEDLHALTPAELAGLAELCGTKPTVKALLKAGARTWRAHRKRRRTSPIAMMLPMLLPALARYAARLREE